MNIKQNGRVMEMMIHVQIQGSFGNLLLLNLKTLYPILNSNTIKKVQETHFTSIKCMKLCQLLIHLMEGVTQ